MNNIQLRKKLKERLERVNVRMESKTSDQAQKMGLDYMHFGRWGKNGQVTHKTQNGKLVPVQSPTDDMLAKGPTNPDTAMIGKTTVNQAPDSVVNKTSIAGPRTNPKQDFGVHYIPNEKADKFLPGLLKKLQSDHPNTSITIEPDENGYRVTQNPRDIDDRPIG